MHAYNFDCEHPRTRHPRTTPRRLRLRCPQDGAKTSRTRRHNSESVQTGLPSLWPATSEPIGEIVLTFSTTPKHGAVPGASEFGAVSSLQLQALFERLTEALVRVEIALEPRFHGLDGQAIRTARAVIVRSLGDNPHVARIEHLESGSIRASLRTKDLRRTAVTIAAITAVFAGGNQAIEQATNVVRSSQTLVAEVRKLAELIWDLGATDDAKEISGSRLEGGRYDASIRVGSIKFASLEPPTPGPDRGIAF
jgi:hypothetical protein